MNMQFLAAIGAVGLLVAGTVQADAHAHLVSATPAEKAVVASPSNIVVHFSEGLEPKFSSFDLTNAAGAKIAMADIAVDAKDKKTLTGTPKAPLAPGAYEVAWHVVAGDGHKSEGKFGFTVK
jgi:methionine-rich copper-binding protein CopC